MKLSKLKCVLLNEAHSFGLKVNIDLFSVVGSIVHSPEIQARHFQGTQPGIKMQQIFLLGAVNFFCFFVISMFTCRSVLMIMILYGELCNLQEDFGVRRISALELRLIFQMFSKSKNFLRLSHSWLECKL